MPISLLPWLLFFSSALGTHDRLMMHWPPLNDALALGHYNALALGHYLPGSLLTWVTFLPGSLFTWVTFFNWALGYYLPGSLLTWVTFLPGSLFTWVTFDLDRFFYLGHF